MEPKQYRAGRSAHFMYVGFIAFWLLFAAFAAMWSKKSIWYLLPAYFILLSIFKLYKLIKHPMLEISDKELIIHSPHALVPLHKIITIRSEGKKKIELIFPNRIPQQVFIGELSKEDRRDFIAELEKRTGAKLA